MQKNAQHTPLVLMILDGWGSREPADDNAISLADTPCWDQLQASGISCTLETSGEAVGLPDGQMGNSEVGHMNIGAGRVVYQEFTRITRAIRDGSFAENPVLCQAIDKSVAADSAVHIMGLLSPGGVHSHEEHLFASIELAAFRGAKKIYIHCFLDGRDTPPCSARESLVKLQALVDTLPQAQIATLCGRYYAMDRDQRWERVKQAYRAIAQAEAAHQAASALDGLDQSYQRDHSDEFVQPTLISEYPGVNDGDSIIFVNFRADRAREISQAFVAPDFEGFERQQIQLSDYVCMTEYLAGLPASVAYPPNDLPRLFGELLAENGLRQLRIAETEKYAHVTFFFNGGQEQPFEGEDRILIPSPQVATYDLQPEMSAPELAEQLSRVIASDQYQVIICNVANPDMVGHTGNLQAAIKAVEAVDQCLASVKATVDEHGGELLITADHGNVEQMSDSHTGQRHTAHTTNPVPLLYYGRSGRFINNGSLQDIAPTMLYLLGLEQPSVMTGRSLLELSNDKRSVA